MKNYVPRKEPRLNLRDSLFALDKNLKTNRAENANRVDIDFFKADLEAMVGIGKPQLRLS